ncbi:protein FAM210A-like [Drosophila serrata]|uniref:protein FAM210A-like n=1 Tax=Drosophila serrata TaxID=7274 RepID=UPI000A1D10D1|nr:protein FAM210A-like [Drosophila serrata]
MLFTSGKLSVLRVANLAPKGLHYVKRTPTIQAFHMTARKQHNYIAAAQKIHIPIKVDTVTETSRFLPQQRHRDQISTAFLAPLSTSAPAKQWVTYDPKFTIESQDKAFSLQRRSYSTKSEPMQPVPTSATATSSTSSSSSSSSSVDAQNGDKLSKKEQLKRAFKDYGATIVAFHVGISLISLGGFYALVSSGINFVPVLEMLGIASSAIAEKVATGSTFVVAYAVHKVFAPVRISITLGSTPFIVRYLRSKGFMKPKPQGK